MKQKLTKLITYNSEWKWGAIIRNKMKLICVYLFLYTFDFWTMMIIYILDK